MGMEGSPNLCGGVPEWGKGALEVGCGMLDAFFQTNMVPKPPFTAGQLQLPCRLPHLECIVEPEVQVSALPLGQHDSCDAEAVWSGKGGRKLELERTSRQEVKSTAVPWAAWLPADQGPCAPQAIPPIMPVDGPCLSTASSQAHDLS